LSWDCRHVSPCSAKKSKFFPFLDQQLKKLPNGNSAARVKYFKYVNFERLLGLGMVVHTYNFSTQEAETGGL
jgi:hypothetical protein